MAQLIFSRSAVSPFRIRLQGLSTKIGRSAQNDVVLHDGDVSRDHAALFAIEGQYFLKKTGTGTVIVNGKNVESHPLQDGDRFEIGTWEVLFQKTDSSDSEADTRHGEAPQGSTQSARPNPGECSGGQLSLQVLEPGFGPRRIEIPTGAFLIGAGQGNDLQLQDPYVSNRHLKVMAQQGKLKVFDLGSTNGTFVNGLRLQEGEIMPGAILKVGQCQLTLMVSDAAMASVPAVPDKFFGLVGGSAKMRELYGVLERVGGTEATALILGESGTGKELVAQALHQLSGRAKKPFVAINCGAISAELIESELFGHEKGAFTGAERRHEGAFGQARGGTLFLDEIGELPLELQPKLLRVLENKTYRRVGGNEEQAAEVRVIAATHQNLASAVQQKRFREDLFFRLFVVPVYIPPLRERPQDIDLLIGYFLEEFSVDGSPKSLSDSARMKLFSAPWSGNVRELRNVLLRATILSMGSQIAESEIIFPRDFSGEKSAEPLPPLEKLEVMERKLVLRALVAHQWNKARTAEALGIAKSTLFSKIKLYGLEDGNATLEDNSFDSSP